MEPRKQKPEADITADMTLVDQYDKKKLKFRGNVNIRDRIFTEG